MQSGPNMKKEFDDQLKQIEILNTRVHNLKLKNQQEEKKIEFLKKQAEDVELRKKQHDSQIKNRQKLNLVEDEKLKTKQQQNLLKKKQRQLEMEQVRQAVLEIKKTEYLKLSQMSQQHQLIIEDQRNKRIQQNKEKKIKINSDYNQARSNYEKFFQERQKNFEQQRALIQKSMEESVFDNSLLLKQLEDEENRLTQDLQYKQQIKQKTKKQLTVDEKYRTASKSQGYRSNSSMKQDFSQTKTIAMV